MADPMDYTMDEGHGEPSQNSNSVPQCQYRPPHSPPNSNNFGSQSRDAHHYDPVHNTESWHQANAAGSQSRQPPQYAGAHNNSQWGPPSWGLPIWPGPSEAHRGSQGPDLSLYPQQPGYMGMPPSGWGDMRGYEPQASPFGNAHGGYGPPGDSAESYAAGRIPQATSTISQASTMRRYTNIGQMQQAYIERATRTRDEAVRNLNARLRVERQAAGIPPNPSSFGYLLNHSAINSSHPRQRDDPDWDSDDEDESISAESDYYTNPYRATAMFGGDMDDERRIAVARASLAGGKKVPSKEFVASLEKLDLKEIQQADRTCMICYNEFGIQNPDGVVEQAIRLPKCKHVFGDKCIKKWFEDSDSCPYCRDKLPAEHVHRKHPNIEALYQAHARRNQLAQAAAQAHNARARAGLPARVSDDLNYGSSGSQYYRNSPLPDDYHYIMRGSGPTDTWSHSPSNRSRESPESRRRQARGRAGLGRPTSVGSARLISSNPSSPPNPQNSLRAHLQTITPNSLNTTPANAPRRSITPALTRQASTGSSPTVTTPPRSRLSETSSPSSSEEASPPVAVGSGVAPGSNLSSSTRSYPTRVDRWADPYRNYLAPNESYFPPGRSPRDMEHLRQPTSTEARSGGSDMPPHSFGDPNFHEALSGNRWSR